MLRSVLPKKKKKIKSVFSLAMGDCIAQRKAGEIWLKGLNFIFLFSQKKTNTKSACLELHDWTFLSLQLDEWSQCSYSVGNVNILITSNVIEHCSQSFLEVSTSWVKMGVRSAPICTSSILWAVCQHLPLLSGSSLQPLQQLCVLCKTPEVSS